MNTPPDLIKAIRTGQISKVINALEAGASVELHDGQGDPGLPMAMACFMGFPEIVRELALRGAHVNVDDNTAPTSPLSMALRARKTEVVKVLVELGAIVPPGVDTGLTENELILARWKASRFGTAKTDAASGPEFEEIQMTGCYGTDTSVLEADVVRYARELGKGSK